MPNPLRLAALALIALGCSRSPAPAPAASGKPAAGAAPLAADVLPAFDEASARHARTLIDALGAVKEEGLGYAGAYTGSSFLPYPESGEAGVMLLGQPPPAASPSLAALVALGAPAVPALLDCLSSDRPTAIPPVRAMQWMSFADEYDVNRRTEPAPPSAGNHDDGPADPKPYSIVVGDLCFVALGQIVNRYFNAVRYQPSGGLVVNSPPRSSALRKVVTDAFAGFTSERHRAALARDFSTPDHEQRREGALLRLSFYYPATLEALAVPLLARPTFDVFAVERFAREVLYREADPNERRALFERFTSEHGPAAKAGLEQQLFQDLSTLEADEQGRLSPRGTAYGKQPRELLIALYHHPAAVRAENKPHVDHLSIQELARLVKMLRHDRSARIDEAVHGLMTTTADVDVALACMARLAKRGYQDDVQRVARRFLDKGAGQAEEQLRKMLP